MTHLLGYHADAPLDFLRWLTRGALDIEEVAGDLDRITELMQKYRDVPMDFADATLVSACERLGLRQIATLDADFRVYRIHGRHAFQNMFPS